ncbi:MAG: hypothetical protein IPJ69_13980 [Deltaproteobacteria bacterium]|nr:MAG: hypothetical protein IPJ69_13980 [Deltaproteobacteria bacterium]
MFLKRILNDLRFKFHHTLSWSRPGYFEKSMGDLSAFDKPLQEEMLKLKSHYSMAYEERLSEENTRDNYFYLHLLDQSQKNWNFVSRQSEILPEVLDVGSKNFYYVDTLHAFFKPKRLVGLEVDGHTIYHDLHSRKDYASYYLKPYPEACYVIENIFDYTGSFDIITCFYPFVFSETAINWSLPLSFFNPEKFFLKIESLLKNNGLFWMLNHGEEEWEAAQKILAQTKLQPVGNFTEHSPLSSCDSAACVSLWKKVV